MDHYRRVLWLFLALVTHRSDASDSSQAPPELIRSESRIEVRRGGSVFLRPADVFEKNAQLWAHICRVQVKANEPVSERSGSLHPRLFDCDFAEDRVRYIHDGSPFTNSDTVLLQVHLFSEGNSTTVVTVAVYVDVIDTPYDVIVMSQRQLAVSIETQLTFPIDSTVLLFTYSFSYDTYCSVSFSHGLWPRAGQVIRGLKHESVREFHEDCRDFLHKGYRYEYFGNLTVHNVDYVPLKVSFYNGIGQGNVTEENYFLPVNIPKLNAYIEPRSSNDSIMFEVTEYQHNAVNSALLQSIDTGHSKNEYVMYEITYPSKPSLKDTGYFVHENDQTTPITSFSHTDLTNRLIEYYPKTRNTAETMYTYESIVFKITAYNVYMQTSQPHFLNIIFHNQQLVTKVPLVVVKPVIVNEGSETSISHDNFIFPRGTKLEDVKFAVRGGLKHGRLRVNGSSSLVFSYPEMESGSVHYVHDESRAPDDRLSMRVTDDKWAYKVRLPVIILPRDNSSPQITTKKELLVKHRELVRITSDHLYAKDRDSESTDIVYHIKMQPKLGVVEKAYHSLSRGVEISRFTQEDINNGYIFYHHTSPLELSKDTYDTFEFRLSDSVPNKSSSHLMGIKIVPRNGFPPEKSGTLQLLTKETEITYITRDMLQFSSNSSPGQLTYTILTQPFFVKSVMTRNAGRIAASRNLSVETQDKSQDIPAIWTFTQEDIDTGQVAYLPPIGDTGPVRRHAQFMFSVTDLFGNTIMDQSFDITITPVNNIAPQIKVGDITTPERGHVIISTNQINALDQDTEPEKLYFTIKQVPKFGMLMRGEDPLVLGDNFSLQDLTDNVLRYEHDGSVTSHDSFILLLSDGTNSITTEIPIYIHPRVGYPEYDDVMSQYTDADRVQEKYTKYDDVLPNDEAGVYASSAERYGREGLLVIDKRKPYWNDVLSRENEEELQDFGKDDNSREMTPSEHIMTSQQAMTSSDAILTSPEEAVPSSEITLDSEERTAITMGTGINQASREQDDVIEHVHKDIDELLVPEMGEVRIAVENLQLNQEQASNLDTRFSFLPPSMGEILLHGQETSEFSLEDVRYGLVLYRHKGGEIGSDADYDSVTMSVITSDHVNIFNAPLITMNVTITPVDNQRPTILLGDKIYVQEGESIGLSLDELLAEDVDTAADDLVFYIAREPKWGYIENMRLHSVSGRGSGRQVESFTYTDLKNGYINYVQANHSGFEPVDDILDLYVSDGKHNSLPAQIFIKILPVNDEMPQFDLEEVIIEEGSSRILSPEFVKAYDLDRPEQRLVLSLTLKPRHGELVIKYMTQPGIGQGFEIPMNDVTINDIQQGRMKLVYKHDGSEEFEDEFTLQLTDGVHVARKTAKVKVIPQNDELPEIIQNGVLAVDFGGTTLITSTILRAVDKDNRDAEIMYVLISTPRKGMIQKKNNTHQVVTSFMSYFGSEDAKWDEIRSGENFTQSDINNNMVRYVHTGASVTKHDRNAGNFDKFVFQLFDGLNTLPPVSFDVDIVGSDNMHIALLNRGIKVTEGDNKILTTNVLSASDSSNDPDQLLYMVTSGPRFGRLSFVATNESSTFSFTQADLEARRVMYSHTSKEDSHEDAIRFTIVNGLNHTRIAIFKIIIEPIDRILPSLDRNMPLTVIQDEAVTLTSFNLHISDPDTPPGNLTYLIVEPPHFGVLLLSGAAVAQFTQYEVDERLIQYKNAGSNRAGVDYFLFTISDGHNMGFRVNGTLEKKPAFFNFLVQPPEKKPPAMVNIEPPTALQSLGNGKFGFIFTSENLKAVHDKRSSDDVMYSVVERPQHGYLQNLREFRPIRKKFSQKDVDEGNVAFVLADGIQATGDNFTFQVYDAISQSSLEEQTYEMTWAMIEFAHGLHIVCEDAGYLLVVLHRKGSTDGSAYVDYKQKSMSARVGLDYKLLETTKRVMFEPGQQYAAIDVQIYNDGLPEDNEKFRLKLKKAENAVVGPVDKSVVQIINFHEGKCDEYIGMISRAERDPLGFGYEDMFPGRTYPPEPTTTTTVPTTRRAAFDVFDYGLKLYEDSLKGEESEEEEGDRSYSDYLELTDIELLPAENDENKPSIVNGRYSHTLLPTPVSTVAPQACTGDIKDLLYFDMRTSKVYKCDGEKWLRWGWGSGYALNDASGSKQAGQGHSGVGTETEKRQEACPQDWEYYAENCYRFITERQTWEESLQKCQYMGGHLSDVTSQKHLDWLWKLTDKERFWIGLSSVRPHGDWRYSSGASADFSHWKPGYPKIDIVRRYNAKECVLVIGKTWWVNRPCNRSRAGFVCSKKAATIAPTELTYPHWFP